MKPNRKREMAKAAFPTLFQLAVDIAKPLPCLNGGVRERTRLEKLAVVLARGSNVGQLEKKKKTYWMLRLS